MIVYPKELDPIFKTFALQKINAIIVGGFVRDSLLGLSSKDIDIELYGADSLTRVEKILSSFGKTNSVGKSFGVCKLVYKAYDLDFSLPRKENKIASGHKGFEITTEKILEFKEAALRRDFTINAIGFDVGTKKLLDPFGGIEDLQKRVLKAVNAKSFIEDPLRLLRGVGFSARYDLKLDDELVLLFKRMIIEKQLDELPKERIFTEIEKIILKSSMPSKAFFLLESLGAWSFFKEFASLSQEQTKATFQSLDTLKRANISDKKETNILGFSLLCRFFNDLQTQSFLSRVTNETDFIKKIEKLLKVVKNSDFGTISDYFIYQLASKIEIRFLLIFLRSIGFDDEKYENIKKSAITLGVYTNPLPALLRGKDLLAMGLKPSKEFSSLLSKCYEAQMQGVFSTKDAAVVWMQNRLLNGDKGL